MHTYIHWNKKNITESNQSKYKLINNDANNNYKSYNGEVIGGSFADGSSSIISVKVILFSWL